MGSSYPMIAFAGKLTENALVQPDGLVELSFEPLDDESSLKQIEARWGLKRSGRNRKEKKCGEHGKKEELFRLYQRVDQ